MTNCAKICSFETGTPGEPTALVEQALFMIPDKGTMTKSGLAASYGGSGTVLVVEDEAAVCRCIRRVLGVAGYQVLTASNAVEAVEIAADHQVIIHLLLTDFSLPGISGQELARVLQRSRPGIRVLFMSGHGKAELPPISDGSDAPFPQAVRHGDVTAAGACSPAPEKAPERRCRGAA